MTVLASRHLTTLTLDVGFRDTLTVGPTPAGVRRIAPVNGGNFVGEGLNGTVRGGGADWVIFRPDGAMIIDVRLILDTADGALIYLTYQGRFLAAPEAMARFAKGELLAAADYSLVVTARFECGDPRYRWINDAVVVGTGTQTLSGPIYDFHEIG